MSFAKRSRGCPMQPSDTGSDQRPSLRRLTRQFTANPYTKPPTRPQRLAALGHCLLERLETPLFVTDAQGAVPKEVLAAMRCAAVLGALTARQDVINNAGTAGAGLTNRRRGF